MKLESGLVTLKMAWLVANLNGVVPRPHLWNVCPELENAHTGISKSAAIKNVKTIIRYLGYCTTLLHEHLLTVSGLRSSR